MVPPVYITEYNDADRLLIFNSYHSMSNTCKKIALYCMGDYVNNYELTQKLIALFSECNKLNMMLPCAFHKYIYETSKTFCYQSVMAYRSSTKRHDLLNNIICLNDKLTRTLVDNDDRYKDEGHIVLDHSIKD